MKSFLIVISFAIFIIATAILLRDATPAKTLNLKRVGNNPKIFCYNLVKNPSNVIEKFHKSADKIMPGLSQKMNVSPEFTKAKAVLDKIEFILSVGFLNETQEKQTSFINLLKISDKAILDDPFIAMLKPKLVVDHFILFGGEPERLKEFADNHLEDCKNINSHDDIATFADFKAIFANASQTDKETNRSAFALIEQFDNLNIALNITDNGIEISFKINPAKGSNFENAFNQKKVNAEKLLGYVNSSHATNLIMNTIDLKKMKPLIADIVQVRLDDDRYPEKAFTKDIHNRLNEFIDIVGNISYASSVNIGDDRTPIQSQIFKTERPEAILDYIKNLDVTMKDVLTKADKETAQEIRELIDIKIKENDNKNGVKIYSIEPFSQKDKKSNVIKDLVPSTNYVSAVQKYLVVSNNKEELIKIVTQIKTKAPIKDITLFAQKHYGASKTLYFDFDIRQIALVKMLLGFTNFGDNIINADIKPIAMHLTANKNLEGGLFFDFSTISAIVAEGQKTLGISQSQESVDDDDDEDDGDNNKTPAPHAHDLINIDKNKKKHR